MLLSYKAKLLEQLARVRMSGHKCVYRGVSYCLQCNQLWHGRRGGLDLAAPVTVLRSATGDRLYLFAHVYYADTLLLTGFNTVPTVVADIVALRGQLYASCLDCACKALQRSVTQQPTPWRFADRAFEDYVTLVYDL